MATPDGSIVNALGEDHDDIDAPTLPVGFVIAGKYEVKRVLGVGGNGAVYEGEHTEVGHRVAIKVAHHKEDDRGDVMSRFRREAKICGSLRHPHIGQVFDVGTLAEGAPYMVMELQEGRSLADVRSAEPNSPVPRCVLRRELQPMHATFHRRSGSDPPGRATATSAPTARAPVGNRAAARTAV